MKEWLDEFYSSDATRAALTASFGPLFRKYASGVWKAEGGSGAPPAEFVSGLIVAYVTHHLESSRAQLQEVAVGDAPLKAITQRLDEWSEKRPLKVALNETIRASNALAQEQMRSSGVERKVWRSSGGSCPYCTSLNGKAVEITQNFFDAGDEFTPEGADAPLTFTSNVGHPPVHQGCDCSVVPG